MIRGRGAGECMRTAAEVGRQGGEYGRGVETKGHWWRRRRSRGRECVDAASDFAGDGAADDVAGLAKGREARRRASRMGGAEGIGVSPGLWKMPRRRCRSRSMVGVAVADFVGALDLDGDVGELFDGYSPTRRVQLCVAADDDGARDGTELGGVMLRAADGGRWRLRWSTGSRQGLRFRKNGAGLLMAFP